MNVDPGDEPRFRSPDPCPQCGDVLDGGVIVGDDGIMVITVRCLTCGYSALIDPFS
ncbi:hypothetical protein WDJ51_14005 [Rathayibacter sp. YIM 133350]|uniref:hypothetical protein n=1 Tax=Rathayibacter sp. YIM 133350 TaxID=3131992 RepID=UPI00307F2139